MEQPETYLRISDIQKRLQCSRTHVYSLFKAGLKYTRIGKKAIRIKPEHYNEFIDSREVVDSIIKTQGSW